MPLQKSITDKAGVATTYWVVTSVHADMVAQSASVTLSGWLTDVQYKANAQPSSRRPYFFSVPFSVIPSAASGSISIGEIYSALVTIINDPAKNSPFAGATLVA